MNYGYYRVKKEDIPWFEITIKSIGNIQSKNKIEKDLFEFEIKFKDFEIMDRFNDSIRNSSDIQVL